jgi:hypothetical protein
MVAPFLIPIQASPNARPWSPVLPSPEDAARRNKTESALSPIAPRLNRAVFTSLTKSTDHKPWQLLPRMMSARAPCLLGWQRIFDHRKKTMSTKNKMREVQPKCCLRPMILNPALVTSGTAARASRATQTQSPPCWRTDCTTGCCADDASACQTCLL